MEWIIEAKDSGVKLIAFLTQHLEGQYSARHLKRVIERNGCRINGRTERFASTVLGQGDHVTLEVEQALPPKTNDPEPQRILFEDDSLFVYDKPAGVSCDDKGILFVLKKINPSLQLIHRLDRETTGVLLLAKQQKVFENLVKQFKALQVHKKYLAIVDGKVGSNKGVIENYLGKKKAFAGQTLWGSVNPSEGLKALTEWKCLERGKTASLLSCTPKTGRTHQIRVHLAEMGHPILGDFQYGRHFQSSYRPSRILLHAEEIAFLHPATGKPLVFSAPLPKDFNQAIQELGLNEYSDC